MKDVVFNEVVSGRRIMVFKHTKPWTYYAGYIQNLIYRLGSMESTKLSGNDGGRLGDEN